ncbi:MAG: hypothetical protein WC615_00310 [Mucilaginibacter sp.]|jgi:hypothetical protein|uniref:hypothetical protein n=1 Tax=Mucilaginibacter sp. TaxID=1882438 RepID=UPI0035677CA8
MTAAVNFYELKTQLADLGYADPEIVDHLRDRIIAGTYDFRLPYQESIGSLVANYSFNIQRQETNGPMLFDHLDAAIYHPGQEKYFYAIFSPDISRDEVRQVLQRGLEGPFIADELPDYFDRIKISNFLNQNNMNTQNLEFLKKSLLNLGFGEQVNADLEKNINKKVPEFNLAAKHEFNQQTVDYNLHFKAGENQEMYFFNKFDTTLHKGKENEQNQTFYINKGNGVTAKEAFNLMEGRAVYKQLYNKEGEGYHAWLQLDNSSEKQNGNKEIKRFNENYGFDLDAVLKDKGIKELTTPEGTENLYRSLRKGNTQQITLERNGEDKKYFIAASPQFKTVDLFDHQMKKIKREELLKPEQQQTTGKKQSEQQKEDAPAKKQSRKAKVHV